MSRYIKTTGNRPTDHVTASRCEGRMGTREGVRLAVPTGRGTEHVAFLDTTEARALLRDLADALGAEYSEVQLYRLLRGMGCTTVEQASQRIQEHAPWNGRLTCDKIRR